MKTSGNTKRQWGYRENGFLMYCWWEDCKSGTTTLEKRWAVSYKTKHALNMTQKFHS